MFAVGVGAVEIDSLRFLLGDRRLLPESVSLGAVERGLPVDCSPLEEVDWVERGVAGESERGFSRGESALLLDAFRGETTSEDLAPQGKAGESTGLVGLDRVPFLGDPLSVGPEGSEVGVPLRGEE